MKVLDDRPRPHLAFRPFLAVLCGTFSPATSTFIETLCMLVHCRTLLWDLKSEVTYCFQSSIVSDAHVNLTAAFGVVSHRLATLAGWVATALVAHVVAPAGSLARA